MSAVHHFLQHLQNLLALQSVHLPQLDELCSPPKNNCAHNKQCTEPLHCALLSFPLGPPASKIEIKKLTVHYLSPRPPCIFNNPVHNLCIICAAQSSTAACARRLCSLCIRRSSLAPICAGRHCAPMCTWRPSRSATKYLCTQCPCCNYVQHVHLLDCGCATTMHLCSQKSRNTGKEILNGTSSL